MKKSIFSILCITVSISYAMASELEQPVKPGKIGLDLKKAVEIALENNPAILEAKENSDSAYYGTEAAEAGRMPKITSSYSVTQLDQQPYSSGTGMRIPVEDKTNFSWDVTAIQPLFTGFALTSQCNIAKKNLDISKTGVALAKTETAYIAKKAYISKLLAGKMVRVAEDSVKSLEAHARDAGKFYEQGMIPYSDLLKAQVGLASAKQSLENALGEDSTSHQRLILVLDMNQNQEIILADLSGIPEKPDWAVYDEKAAFEARPELNILKLQAENTDFQIRLAESTFYPRVSLMGKYEQNGKDSGTTEHDYKNRFNSSIRVQADWTLFEGGKAIQEKKALESKKRAIFQKIGAVENQIRLDLKESISGLKVSEANFRTSSAALDQARENWRITNLQFLQQMATASDVLDARAFLNRAETDYHHSLYGCHMALAGFARAVGKY